MTTSNLVAAIKGVIVRPNGDVTEKFLSRFTDKYILPTDPIFTTVLPTEMSVLIELPLLVQRLNDRDLIPGNAYHKNCVVTFLHVRPCSGLAPLDWQRRVGAVLVVRMDRKPLSGLHLEAIWRYHWSVLSDLNSVQIGFERHNLRVSRKAFEIFWSQYKKKQIEAGREDFEELGSPYDM
jgi:hypothetical protein